jgi:hypothetical protein
VTALCSVYDGLNPGEQRDVTSNSFKKQSLGLAPIPSASCWSQVDSQCRTWTALWGSSQVRCFTAPSDVRRRTKYCLLAGKVFARLRSSVKIDPLDWMPKATESIPQGECSRCWIPLNLESRREVEVDAEETVFSTTAVQDGRMFLSAALIDAIGTIEMYGKLCSPDCRLLGWMMFDWR